MLLFLTPGEDRVNWTKVVGVETVLLRSLRFEPSLSCDRAIRMALWLCSPARSLWGLTRTPHTAACAAIAQAGRSGLFDFETLLSRLHAASGSRPSRQKKGGAPTAPSFTDLLVFGHRHVLRLTRRERSAHRLGSGLVTRTRAVTGRKQEKGARRRPSELPHGQRRRGRCPPR